MQMITLEQLLKQQKPLAVAIGFFDGVHRGHQAVIERAVEQAQNNQQKSLVITFDKLPSKGSDGYLTPLDAKLKIIETLDVDYVLVLAFNDYLKNLSADQFIAEYLVATGVNFVSVGFDFKFGHCATGNTATLIAHRGFKVEIIEEIQMTGAKVSTTKIKKALQQGDLETTQKMLGRPFTLSGTVIHGQQLGRTIGFPTANLQLDADQFVGLRGVFATKIHTKATTHQGMTNIGFNPTVDSQGALSVETHIFDFNEEIYENPFRFEILSKIRDEKKFDGLDQLITQLNQDRKIAKKLLKQA